MFSIPEAGAKSRLLTKEQCKSASVNSARATACFVLLLLLLRHKLYTHKHTHNEGRSKSVTARAAHTQTMATWAHYFYRCCCCLSAANAISWDSSPASRFFLLSFCLIFFLFFLLSFFLSWRLLSGVKVWARSKFQRSACNMWLLLLLQVKGERFGFQCIRHTLNNASH